MQAVVRRFLRTYADRHGATLLLTSHYMEDVKALCPRVILIDQGKLLHDGALETLVSRFSTGKRVRLRLEEAPLTSLASFGKIIEQEEEIVVFEVPSDGLAESVQHMLKELRVRDLSVEDPPLADTMARIFRPEPAA
jgi:ABC-2 type transport system ATP-binding protein